MESAAPFPRPQDVVRAHEKADLSSMQTNEDSNVTAVNEADQDREYGCKYCRKKFSNKQALGGHQNAHKLERAMEKNVQENPCRYFGGSFAYPGMASANLAFHGSYGRYHEYPIRALYRPHPSHQTPLQHEIPVRYNPPTSLPMTGEPYPSRQVPGFKNVYSGAGMVAPVGRQASPYIPKQCFNCADLAIGSGSSGGGTNPEEFALKNNSELHQAEDSDLDLSLKL